LFPKVTLSQRISHPSSFPMAISSFPRALLVALLTVTAAASSGPSMFDAPCRGAPARQQRPGRRL
jgi:hypothetical protein